MHYELKKMNPQNEPITEKGNHSPCGGEGGSSLTHTPMLSTSDFPMGEGGGEAVTGLEQPSVVEVCIEHL